MNRNLTDSTPLPPPRLPDGFLSVQFLLILNDIFVCSTTGNWAPSGPGETAAIWGEESPLNHLPTEIGRRCIACIPRSELSGDAPTYEVSRRGVIAFLTAVIQLCPEAADEARNKISHLLNPAGI